MQENYAKEQKGIKALKAVAKAIELSLGERKEVKVQKLEGEKRLLEPS